MIKTAFITGAASGIGKSTVEALYANGWTLGIADINLDALKEYSANWDPNRVHCYQLDVRDANQVTDCIKSFAENNKQRLNLLFNCAGILQIDRFEDVSTARHQQIFEKVTPTQPQTCACCQFDITSAHNSDCKECKTDT